ncbi:MAG: AAA family ATPase [Bacteroidales bacterium]|nr:AAA family ATPase [Clostridium sp.]MCM1202611.1 AAA family ATPase [Bacteroidales bacterium]
MEIDGKTRLIGLAGNPVEHTLSPVIHNEISKRMEISSVYVPFKVETDGLADAVKGAWALNILGMNVTVPHKNQVMESLVETDEAALRIGAVNTLVRLEEKCGYKGYNTDMMGLRRQIHEDGIRLQGETVVVLGAGGAARAVVYLCLSEGAKRIYLLNRTVEKAEKLAESMNQIPIGGTNRIPTEGMNQIPAESMNQIPMGDEDTVKPEADRLGMKNPGIVIPLCLTDYAKIPEDGLIVFQATSIGLFPHVEETVLTDSAFYRKVKTGIDLIYNPAETGFMRMVKAHGGKAYNALKMLLYQGVIAYELWHDIKVPEEVAADIYVELKRKVYPKDNVVLIGFMGSGKTTFGKALAKRLGMEFLDTDAYIEKKAGKRIADIFDSEGEAAFRKLETEVLADLRDNVKNTVLATGGGMPLRAENARLLKEIGKVCYLTAAPQVIYERIKGNTDRPLLQGDNPYGKICELMKERKPKYQMAADVAVDTDTNDLEEIVAELVKQTKGENTGREKRSKNG